MESGSKEAIFYEFCQFLDEVLHGLNLDNFRWSARFCMWTHRKG